MKEGLYLEKRPSPVEARLRLRVLALEVALDAAERGLECRWDNAKVLQLVRDLRKRATT